MALDRIAASLAVPFAGGDVGLQLGVAQPLETTMLSTRRMAIRRPAPSARPRHRPGGAGRTARQAGARGGLVLRLGQDAPAARDDRIGREDEGARVARRHGACFRLRQPHDMRRRQLAFVGASSISAGSIRSGTMPI